MRRRPSQASFSKQDMARLQAEIRKNPDQWIPSIKIELSALFEKEQALRKIPGMMAGKNKSTIFASGNFAETDDEMELYASGPSAISLRFAKRGRKAGRPSARSVEEGPADDRGGDEHHDSERARRQAGSEPKRWSNLDDVALRLRVYTMFVMLVAALGTYMDEFIFESAGKPSAGL